nr:unnamed protein product [Callosobruchus analis]CAI5869804.1 unnamed protein product [Callosobruchus analis]
MISLAHVNVRSLLSHFGNLKAHVLEKNFTFLLVSETWLSQGVSDSEVSIEGYKILRNDRAGRGGGVAIYFSHHIPSVQICPAKFNTFESLFVNFKLNREKIVIGVVYRPPGVSSVQDFLNEFEEAIGGLLIDCDKFICGGDFNINLLSHENTEVQQFHNILYSYELSQLVEEPTHNSPTSQSLIDLIISSSKIQPPKVSVYDINVSDHLLTECQFSIYNRSQKCKYVTFRDYRNFNIDTFNAELDKTDFHSIFYTCGIDEKLQLFNKFILDIYDKYAPKRTVRVTRNRAPWLTDNLKFIFSLRDSALTKFKNDKTKENWERYKELRNFSNRATENEKKAYLGTIMAQGDVKKKWRTLKSMGTLKDSDSTIPDHLSNVERLSDYYSTDMTSVLAPDLETLNKYLNSKLNNLESFNFTMTDENEVADILKAIKSKAVGSDNIGIDMLIYCCPHILPIITHLINTCIELSAFPDSWKVSHITPIPKNSNPNVFKDLRPISILPTLSKVIEKILERQIRKYLDSYKILPQHQSGFRKGYSCSTALLKVTDDIMEATDRNELTALALLDYSKAFDTLNHELLLAILEFIGFSKESVQLIRSYLTNRKQIVKINARFSESKTVISGVPQGSILGPLLYIVYTSQVHTCLKTCSIHTYADDTQIYLSFKAENINNAIHQINDDLRYLNIVSRNHCLVLNPDKSKAIMFGRKKARSNVTDAVSIKVEGKPIL